MPRIVHTNPDQKFACRECPARCCRMPWRITLVEQEKERILALPWVAGRLAERGVSFENLAGGTIALPMLEKNRILECAFLDDDGLCSIHKREGIDATPQTCQTFPFGFIEREDGTLQTYLSHLCPSIRDNYGDRLEEILPEKAGRMRDLAPLKMVPQMRLGGGHIRQAGYLAWADRAAALFDGPGSPAATLMQIQSWTAALAESNGPGQVMGMDLPETEIPAPTEVAASASRAWSHSTRLLLATCLLPISYPKRVASQKKGLERAMVFARSLDFVLRWVRHKGEVDLLFLSRPIRLEDAFALPSPCANEECRRPLARFLQQLLVRRNFFLTEKSLEETVFLLALAGAIVTIFARMQAASQNRNTCIARDLADGESLAELMLTYHGSMVHSIKALEVLTGFMASYPPSFRGLIETY